MVEQSSYTRPVPGSSPGVPTNKIQSLKIKAQNCNALNFNFTRTRTGKGSGKR